ncbi:MAG TPA: 6-hydroxymethylpterin diphosphokinase MptE-like protein [Pyrinomonadaceae bacterium]
MSIAQRISNALKRDGLSGIALRSAALSLKGLGQRADSWSDQLQNKLTKQTTIAEFGKLLAANEQFRNRHRGQRCFVIGNGPSLKEQDLAPIANECTFVTNYFHLHPIVGPTWQPAYYCLSDPAYFDGSLPLSSLKEIESLITKADFFVPHQAYEFLQRTKVLPADRTFYVATCEQSAAGYARRPDLTTATPGAQTVVQLAIMIAMFMGCSPIYLLGLDHDWLAHGGSHINFYSKEKVEEQPDGNLPGWTYRAMMDAVSTMWEIYELQKQAADRDGIKIVNATRGGFLDVFERANYEDVVAS